MHKGLHKGTQSLGIKLIRKIFMYDKNAAAARLQWSLFYFLYLAYERTVAVREHEIKFFLGFIKNEVDL